MQPTITRWHEPLLVQTHFTPTSRKKKIDITFSWRSIFRSFSSLANDAVAVGIKNKYLRKIVHIQQYHYF
jgi:hypothetical protein